MQNEGGESRRKEGAAREAGNFPICERVVRYCAGAETKGDPGIMYLCRRVSLELSKTCGRHPSQHQGVTTTPGRNS